MNDKANTDLDLAQRIVEYMSRTTKPETFSDDRIKGKDFKVIGTVPGHLRHLHNLLTDLGEEVRMSEIEFLKAKRRFDAVRDIFFDSLETHVPDPEDTDVVRILENWNVVATVKDEEDMMRERLGALFGGSLCD